MEVLHFPSLDEAERHLKQGGYSFQGAPSRWRKEGADTTSYADARARENGAVRPDHPHRGRSGRTGGLTDREPQQW